MAGMLPGVEAARRRRIHHQSSSSVSNPNNRWCSSSTKRLSFSLFSANPNINTSTFLGNTTRSRNRTWTSYEDHDDDDDEDEDDTKLGALAREAKFRLDAKLRSTPLISTTRNYNTREERIARLINNKEDQKKKKNGKVNKLISWNWKTGDRNHRECAVCLDDMKEGSDDDEDIINLECHHSFHSNCLLPWLHTNPHCPCCRLRLTIIHPLFLSLFN